LLILVEEERNQLPTVGVAALAEKRNPGDEVQASSRAGEFVVRSARLL
jgi:hypothetical protein